MSRLPEGRRQPDLEEQLSSFLRGEAMGMGRVGGGTKEAGGREG